MNAGWIPVIVLAILAGAVLAATFPTRERWRRRTGKDLQDWPMRAVKQAELRDALHGNDNDGTEVKS